VTESCISTWSAFTPCYNGNGIHRNDWKEKLLILSPAQISGESCGTNVTVNMVEIVPCDVSDTKEDLPDNINEIDCTKFELRKCGNGRCIDPTLFCNFEDDCGDNTDEIEDICHKIEKNDTVVICGLEEKFGETSIAASYLERWLKAIPGINKFANGFDILTGNYRSAVLDMSPHGSCRRVLQEGQETEYYRLPANVASFRQINSVSFPPANLYSNGEDLMKTLQSELRYAPERAGLISELAGRVGLSQQEDVKSMITKSEAAIYAQQNIEVTKSEVTLQDVYSLIPSNEFVRRVLELPSESFSYDLYLSFVRDFGTHFVAEANLGGVYKQIQEFSRCFVEYGDYEKFTDDPWDKVLPICNKESFFYKLNPDTNPVSSSCRRSDKGKTLYLHDEVDQTVIGTVGGTLSAASNIKFNPSQESWDAWVESISENPTLNTKKFKLMEITEIMSSRYIPMDSDRRSKVTDNLQQAVQIYLGSYDSQQLCAKCEKEGDYLSEIVVGASYLTGTGQDYRCYCSYDDIPTLYTCGASTFTSTIFSVTLATLISLAYNH